MATHGAGGVGASKLSIAAAVIGNALEWFDIIVYGFMAPIIARLFFPEADPTTAVILSLGTFGITLMVRPIGGIVLGRYADRFGRRKALILISSLMFLGTLMIAVAPTYAQIGIAAPLVLIAARLLQGFSAGGEFGASTAYLIEQSPDARAFYSSLQFTSQGISTVLAAGMSLALTQGLPEDQLYAWAWRLPFVFGLLIGPVAYVIRRHVDETPEFVAAQREEAARAAQTRPRDIAGRVAIGTMLVFVATVTLYSQLYMPIYATSVLGIPGATSVAAPLITGLLLLVIPSLAGQAADRWTQVKVALPPLALLVLLPFPLFMMMTSVRSAASVVLAQVTLGAVNAVYLGVLPALMAELFPTQHRTFGLALCYNIATVAIGGFAPVVFALLVDTSGSPIAPAGYIVANAVVSLCALLTARRLGWA